MTGVAAALREKDGKTARELFDKANAACDACHEKFRDAQ
jgi:cytochrome c556